jgi:hypothetical protein
VSRTATKAFAFGFGGFQYGCALWVLAFMAAGAGHGSQVLIGLSSAPLGLLGNVYVAFFSPPFFWCFVGILLALSSRHKVALVMFLLVMLAHYASLFLLLREGGRYGDWHYVNRVADVVWTGIWLYGFVQAAMWVWLAAQLVMAARTPSK